jgi:hypothetical protein
LAIIVSALAYGKKQKVTANDLPNQRTRDSRWATSGRMALHTNRFNLMVKNKKGRAFK